MSRPVKCPAPGAVRALLVAIAVAAVVVAASHATVVAADPATPTLTADTIVERMGARPVAVPLTDVRRIDDVPPSAVASMVAPSRYLAPVGVGPDTLVRRDAARVSVRFAGRGVAIQAGWSGSDADPRPWLAWSSPITGGVPVPVRPVLDAAAGRGLVLREVIAADAERLYLRAERDGATVVLSGRLAEDALRRAVTPRRAGGRPR